MKSVQKFKSQSNLRRAPVFIPGGLEKILDAVRERHHQYVQNRFLKARDQYVRFRFRSSGEDALTDADAPRAANSGFRRDVRDLAITVTPRPSIGKKKAKAVAHQAASVNKKMKVQLPSSPRSDNVKISNQVSLERLASAAETKNEVGKRMALAVEAKNGIAKEQLMIQVFLANPQSVASLAFFCSKV